MGTDTVGMFLPSVTLSRGTRVFSKQHTIHTFETIKVEKALRETNRPLGIHFSTCSNMNTALQNNLISQRY